MHFPSSTIQRFSRALALTVLSTIIILATSSPLIQQERLHQFYLRIAQDDLTFCADRTKLLPGCTDCIPGTKETAGSTSCNEFIQSSQSIRDEIYKLTVQRFGKPSNPHKKFALYPCMLPQYFLTIK